jgi:hypothetical protein
VDVEVVVVDDLRLFVVVVLGAVVDVAALDGAVVLVVLELVGELVEVEVDDEVDVEVVDGVDVVVFVAGAGDDGVKTVGLLAISSTAVTNPNARRKTMAAVPANAFHVNRRLAVSSSVPAAVATPAPPVIPTTPAPSKTEVGISGTVDGSNGSVAASSSTSAAGTCTRSVASTDVAAGSISVVSAPTAPTTSVGSGSFGPPSTEDVVPPAAPVPPMRRSSVEAGPSGTRTTACLTASCPRSIDCDTSAVPRVAAIEPIATPTIVPVTPKLDAMSAAITAPAAEARICRKENFTPRKSN